MTTDAGSETPPAAAYAPLDLQPIAYAVLEGHCDATLARALQLKVAQVLGSSPLTTPGARYRVLGEYTLAGNAAASLRLVCMGRTKGLPASLPPGSGKFEVSGEILEVLSGRETILDLLAAIEGQTDLGVRNRITFQTEAPLSDPNTQPA